MNIFSQTYRKRGFLLVTGQTTSYGSGTGVDDGALQKGIVKAYGVLTLGQYAGNTNIIINAKTDVHANACVFDSNTGLMWSRYVSASIGVASDGKLPWTTTGVGVTAEGIFPYCAAANAAVLAGYSDWRIPNIYSLMSLVDFESPSLLPDSVAFPSFPADLVWSSTTRPTLATAAFTGNYLVGQFIGTTKTAATSYCLLVRG